MKIVFTFFLLACSLTLMGQPTVATEDVQIKTAILAAPADKRKNATIYGYSPTGEFKLIRQGTNEIICLADDPKTPGLNVAAYHRDLEPFMQRGRELKSHGKTTSEIHAIREQEATDGILKMPSNPTALFSYTAKSENFNALTGEIKDGYLRYVVYIPLATAESTGLPLKPDRAGMPWLMDPGTNRAHIMISPPQQTDH